MFVMRSELIAALQRNVELGKRLVAETSRADTLATAWHSEKEQRWAAEARADTLDDEVTHLRAQNGSLLTHVLNAPAAVRGAPTPAAKPVDVVSDAIAEVSGTNSALRKQLGTYAKAQASRGIKATTIAQSLREWPDVDDDA